MAVEHLTPLLLLLASTSYGFSLDTEFRKATSFPPFSRLGVDPNCPFHPYPVKLPSSLPEEIETALSQLGEALQKTINSSNVPGAFASLVYLESEIWSQGFGVVNKSSMQPPDGNNIFRIGSVSKVFVVLMMYQMYERGYIKSLDDPLSKYCPEFSVINTYKSGNITLRQISAQMSGLPREAPCVIVNKTGNGMNINTCPLTTEQILERLQNQSLIFPPWTVPSYSNLGFALLGHCLVESVFPGMMYEDYIIKNILQPLGMFSTGFNITNSVVAKMATGYEPDGSVAPLYDIGWVSPAGQMYSTAADLNTLASFFIRAAGENGSNPLHPEVLSADLLREMELQVFVNRDQLTGFGTPWEIRFQNDYTILRKGGNIYGYSALFSFIPDLKLGLNVLWSGSADEFALSNSAYGYVIPAFVKYLMSVQPLYPYPPDPNEYEGEYIYTSEVTQTIAVITTLNKQLLLTFNTISTFLSYVEPLKFQVSFPDNLQPCLSEELLGLRHAFVVFDAPKNSTESPGFSIPGSFPGVHFERKN